MESSSLKIFHINMHRAWGGQPNRVLTTAIGLRDRGHTVVVSGPKNSKLTTRAREAGFETFDNLDLSSGFHPIRMWRDINNLKRYLEKEKFDIIDTHGSQDSWRVHFALLMMKRKPVWIRSRHNIFRVQGHWFNRWQYGKVDRIITVSPQVIPLLKDVAPAEKCVSIYSAPDNERFRDLGDGLAVRKELGIAPDQPVIGVVGRLAPEKGHRYLVEAAPAILKEHPRTKFVFVGTGRTRDPLLQQIADSGLQEHFILTGFRTDVPQLLAAFDLFVLPSTDGESLGTSILEAFLAGCPVVASDLGGVRESVTPETGILVPPGEAETLGQACTEMLKDRQRARELAAAGKQRVERFFTREAIAEQTEKVYLEALAARRLQSV